MSKKSPGIFFLIWVSGLSKVLVENLLDYRALAKQMTSTDMCQNFQASIHLKSRGGNPRLFLQTEQCSACEAVGGN